MLPDGLRVEGHVPVAVEREPGGTLEQGARISATFRIELSRRMRLNRDRGHPHAVCKQSAMPHVDRAGSAALFFLDRDERSKKALT
jgi:hypothetical protein